MRPLRYFALAKFFALLIIASGYKNEHISKNKCPQQDLPDMLRGKAFLSYLITTPAIRGKLRNATNFEESLWREIEKIGYEESVRLKQIYDESKAILNDSSLDLTRKLMAIKNMQYSSRISEVVCDTLRRLYSVLNKTQRNLFFERALNVWILSSRRVSRISPRSSDSNLSFTVFATQYHGHTTYEVALPDKYLKFANLDWEHHPGYEGSDYMVRLEYGGRQVYVPVLDAGPWNIDDNYWNDLDPPRPRRMFTDLPQGMPEAQAAYFDNYNDGLDQFGREVLNPAGIDLTPAVAEDLGLEYLENAWISVTYLWEPLAGIEYDAIWVDHDYPRSMISGSRAVVWIEYQNTGEAEWDTVDTRIGTTMPRNRESAFYDPDDWISPERPTAADDDSGSYGTGEVVRFTFILMAPHVVEPTTYVEYWGLLQEGVGWFGPPDEAVWFEITVYPDEQTNQDTSIPDDTDDDSDGIDGIYPGAAVGCSCNTLHR
jgi:hypothetical protein